MFEITNNLTIPLGNHQLTFGTHNEFFSFRNVFFPGSKGVWTFASADAFDAGTPNRYERAIELRPGGGEYYVREVASSAEDYYLGRGEAPGRWVGSLATEMGLDGETATHLFDRAEEAGEFDLVDVVSAQLPMLVLSRVLGVGAADPVGGVFRVRQIARELAAGTARGQHVH